MPDKLLFVSHSAEWMGPTKSLTLLLEHLGGRRQVAVLAPGRGRFTDEMERLGIRVLTLPSLTKWRLPEMVRIVRRGRFDLVYANNTRGPARLAFLAARLNRKPFVCHVRAMEWEKSWSQLGYLRLADAVVAVSAACAESVKRFVRPERLHVAYNGVPSFEPEADAGAGSRLRARLGLPADAVVLLSLAHICPRKGQDRALEAMEAIHARCPQAHLCLAGSVTRDAGYVSRLRARTAGLGLNDHVRFLGFRDDVGELLRGADLFVHTALADPHPRSVIEAMAAGLPVVAFAVDGVAETVEDGVTGRLAHPGDSRELAQLVVSLLEDRPAARSLGQAGRRRARETFSAAATAGRIGSIIDGVLEARGAPRPAGATA